MNNKKYFLLFFILVGFILSVKLYHYNSHLFPENIEFDKSKLLYQAQAKNLMLHINENMDNIIADLIVDDGYVTIHLDAFGLEEEKIDDIIRYVSKSLVDFDEGDIIIKNNDQKIIYP